MIPKFEIVDVSMDDGLGIKVVIVDDPRFLGYIFHFHKIEFDYQSDGVGISYDLNIDIHKDYLPTTITDEQTKMIKETAHGILEKIMTDFVDAHNLGALDNPAEML